jgi:MFS transporter, PAT family, beta-lactamase induction signal transducer AmpG
MLAILGFAWLATVNHSLLILGLVIGLEAFGVGLGTAAFVAYIAKTTHPLYTATQFALFTSLAAVPRTVANAGTGFMVENLGWFKFFIVCFVLAIPGMLLLFKVAPWNTIKENEKSL